MKPTITMRKALADKKLLGNVLAGQSWHAWRMLMIAAMGEPLTDAERVTFTQLTGRARRAIAARRGTGSRCRSARRQDPRDGDARCYIAGLCKHPLVPGERGVLLCIAPDQRQAASRWTTQRQPLSSHQSSSS